MLRPRSGRGLPGTGRGRPRGSSGAAPTGSFHSQRGRLRTGPGSRHLPERVGEVHTLFSTGHCTHAQENPQTRAHDRPFGNHGPSMPMAVPTRAALPRKTPGHPGTGQGERAEPTHPQADNEGQGAWEYGCSPPEERKPAPGSTASSEPRSRRISAEPRAKQRRARPPVGRTGLRRKPRRVDLHVW